MKNKIFIVFLLFIVTYLFSSELQDIIITKIIDSNLFLTKSGKIVRLADISTPSIHSKDKLLAESIMEYSQEYILNRPLKYKNFSQTGNDTLDILLIEKYPFNRSTNFNLEFLKQGFGYYRKNGYTHSDPKYIKAELEAKQNHKGIWQTEAEKQTNNRLVHAIVLGTFGDSDIDFAQSYGLSYRLYKKRQIGDISISFQDCFLLKGKIFLRYKNISVNPGIIFITDILNSLASPSIGIDVGLLDKIYLYMDSVSYLPTGNYGVTYKFINSYNEISLGKNFNSSSDYILSVKYKITKLFLTDAKLTYNTKNNNTSYFIGIGIIWGK